MLIGVDVKSNGWRVKQQVGKFENGDHIDEIITEEAPDKRPYKVAVVSDGCGSMSLLQAVALQRGVDHWEIPPYSWDLNMAKGGINHFKQMVSSVMLAAMVPDRPINESFVGYPAAAGCMNASWQDAAEPTATFPHGDTTSELTRESLALWPSARQGLASLIQNFARSEGHQNTRAQNLSSS